MTSADDLTTCDLCGAAVVSEDTHTAWHKQLMTPEAVAGKIAEGFKAIRNALTY